jgi:hypothetical protein
MVAHFGEGGGMHKATASRRVEESGGGGWGGGGGAGRREMEKGRPKQPTNVTV